MELNRPEKIQKRFTDKLIFWLSGYGDDKFNKIKRKILQIIWVQLSTITCIDFQKQCSSLPCSLSNIWLSFLNLVSFTSYSHWILRHSNGGEYYNFYSHINTVDIEINCGCFGVKIAFCRQKKILGTRIAHIFIHIRYSDF